MIETALTFLMQTSSLIDNPSSRWMDAEGASLLATLRKAYADDAPIELEFLLGHVVRRSEEVGFATRAAAAESAALAVAHLLPALLRCDDVGQFLLMGCTYAQSWHISALHCGVWVRVSHPLARWIP